MDTEANRHEFTKLQLCKILDDILGKTLGEIDSRNVFSKTLTNPKVTGIAGDVIEQSVMGYPADNKQEPDLIIDGIKTELKTTGIRLSKKQSNKYEAKEPMSITAVSPQIIVDESFPTSNFWHKLEHLLLVYYLYASNKTVIASEYANFPVKGYEFHEFNADDREILKNDWTTVRDFIRELQSKYIAYEDEYPRISSELRSKLLYIDTAPKWPNRPRFRLKRTVVTGLVQEHFGDALEQLPGKYTSYADIDVKLHDLTCKYAQKTVLQLTQHLGITGTLTNKSIAERIVVRMFDGHAKKLQQINIFRKIGLLAKTVVLTNQGLRTEDMKLFRLDFGEICNPDITFEDSSFYDYFSECQMLCILFEEPNVDSAFEKNIFMGFKRISFSDDFMDKCVRPVWDRIRHIIFSNTLKDVIEIDKTTGLPRKNKKTGIIKSAPNFPKSAEGLIFVRGSSSDSTYKPENVNGISMYAQYLWIKGKYIADRLSEEKFI